MTDWLLGTLVGTSALIVLVLLVREPVRRHFGARVAYGLWLIPVVRLLTPTLTWTVERPVPQAAPIQPFVPAVLAEPRLMASVAESGPSLIEQLGGWTLMATAVWLGVALALLVRGLAEFRSQRAMILEPAVQIARIGSIRILRSPEVSGPLAFGILDRVIAVPTDFDRRFSDGERRLALDHELAHHRSGDLIVNLFAFVLLCLQWFNPLAWVAHAAFRFDQEAACDARVLDKANAGDRIEYGRAIAKAASGRALLFASALDRRHTLKRRLTHMFSTPNVSSRTAGRLAVLLTAVVAVPLTATWAINYVDVPAPAKPVPVIAPAATTPPTPVSAPAVATTAPPVTAVRAIQAVQAVQAVEPVTPVVPAQPDVSFIGKDSVRINGHIKRWDDLTPAERANIRARTREARRELDKQLATLPQELAQAQREAARFRNGEFQREMAKAREEIRRSLAEVDRNSAVMRASGRDPEKIKAEIRASLAEVEQMDIDKVVREALASVDPDKIRREVRDAAKSLDEVDARLDQLDRH